VYTSTTSSEPIETSIVRLIAGSKPAWHLHTLALTFAEQAAVRAAARIILKQEGFPTDPTLQVVRAAKLSQRIESLVPRLPQLLIRLRYEEEVEAVVVQGLPAEKELVSVIALALSCMFGLPFNYQEQLGGALAMPLKPKGGSAANTNTTRDEFQWHSDDAIMGPELRVTWITLYGVHNPPHTLTGYASIRAALNDMPADEAAPLWSPRYRVRVPLSFNRGDDLWSEPRPILTLDENTMISVAWPTYATRLVDPDDREASHALNTLIKCVARQGIYRPIAPGVFFAFNNSRGLHMRTPIGPGRRLVIRTYVRPNLDALRSKSGQPGFVFPLNTLL